MAFTSDATWAVSGTFQDRDRNTATMSFRLPGALLFAAAEAAALVVLNAAAALSDAILYDYNLSRGAMDYSLLVALAPETADVERKGVFQARASNGQIVKFEVPSIKNTLVVDGSNVLLLSDADVTAFMAAIQDTGLGAGNSPVTNAGVDLVANHGTPHKIHRRSSKG
jgi:hypothetical protein